VTATTWPPRPTKADRMLLVELTPHGYWYRGGGAATTTSGFLEIPQGQTTATIALATPNESVWEGLEIRVWEDGILLDDLSTNVSLGNGNSWKDSGPAALLVDSGAPLLAQQTAGRWSHLSATRNLPDVRWILEAFDNVGDREQPNERNRPIDDARLLGWIAGHANAAALHPSELPDRWLHLTCVDVILISVEDLQLLHRLHPAKLAALRHWLAGGTALCVFGAGEQYQRLTEIEQLLAMPPGPVVEETDGRSDVWRHPSADVFQTPTDPRRYAGSAETASPNGEADAALVSPDDERRQFVSREFALGKVLVLAADGRLPLSERTGEALASSLQMQTSWTQRHGMTPGEPSMQFWNQLIPSVKLAPVTAFRVMITLFVIVIGPVNYIVLRRLRRTSLMLATAPLAAAAVTLLLFGYATVRDGFGSKARIRSFSYLDQRTGLHVNWSRQTYFAAFASPRGMTFADDTAVYRIEADNYPSPSRRIDWRGEEQRLASGFLPARETVQFMTLRAGDDARSGGIGVREGEEEVSSAPLVANKLKSPVRQLLVVDSRGKCWWAENLAAGKSLRPVAIEPFEARRRLEAAGNHAPLGPPPGFDQLPYGDFSGGYYGYYDDLDDSSSVLERGIDRWLSAPADTPRSYVAIVESPPGLPRGIEAAHEESSLHVVVGRW
jgi:hypothetical protein